MTYPRPRVVSNGGGCESGEDDAGPTPHPAYSVESSPPHTGSFKTFTPIPPQGPGGVGEDRELGQGLSQGRTLFL